MERCSGNVLGLGIRSQVGCHHVSVFPRPGELPALIVKNAAGCRAKQSRTPKSGGMPFSINLRFIDSSCHNSTPLHPFYRDTFSSHLFYMIPFITVGTIVNRRPSSKYAQSPYPPLCFRPAKRLPAMAEPPVSGYGCIVNLLNGLGQHASNSPLGLICIKAFGQCLENWQSVPDCGKRSLASWRNIRRTAPPHALHGVFHEVAVESVLIRNGQFKHQSGILRKALWLPALPPVSVSMGINVTSSGIAAMAASYRPRIPPVIMPEIISTSSHTMRCLARENTPVFRYGFSDGAMAAIFSKSSVASCSITSTAS